MILRESRIKRLLTGAVTALTIAGCSSAQVAQTQSTIATIAAQIDAGVTTFAQVDLPLVCVVLGTFVGFAEDAVAAGVVKTSTNVTLDLKIAHDLANGPGCAPGTVPVSNAQLVTNILAEIGVIKADLRGSLTVTSAVVATSVNPTAKAVRRWRSGG